MTTTTLETRSAFAAWLRRGRFVLAVALVWAALHFVVDQTVLSRGLNRPVVLLASPGGISGGLLTVLALWVAAALATLLAGRREPTDGLVIVGLGLSFWALEGGTMSDWMKMKLVLTDESAANAYRPLIADYVLLLIAMAGVLVIGTLLAPRRNDSKARDTLRETFAGGDWRNGLIALVVGTAVAAILMLILTGPIGDIRQKQIYFAVAVSCAVGVVVSRRVSGVKEPLWYWLIPFVVGVLGLVIATVRPAPPTGYENVNIIPKLGLVRALPMEMIAVGIVVCIWTLRSTLPRSQPAP